MKQALCGIYSITSPTGKIYVGQSKNIHKRWADYRSLCNCNEQTRLYNSFLKHGVKNHDFIILEECDNSFSNDREIYYIQLFKCVEKGLNIRLGGLGKSLTEETKEKIRAANLGKKMSLESRRKMSEAKKGKPSWNKGLKNIYSKEVLESNRQKHVGNVAWNKGIKGHKMSDETKQKMRESRINFINKNKKNT